MNVRVVSNNTYPARQEPHLCIGGLDTFEINRERAIDYLNTRQTVYVFDGFAGVSPTSSIIQEFIT